MIAVIADDLSGAAEIAGIGRRYGLRAEVQVGFHPETDADLAVINTDSRWCPGEEAAKIVKDSIGALRASGKPVDWFFKKTDSVLRGRIASELNAMLEALGVTRALLVPANPSAGRIIRGTRYYIHNQCLHETDFAHDAEYPAFSSEVLELLALQSGPQAGVLATGHPFPPQGIWVGQSESKSDISLWASRLDDQTLAAGAADFFVAILETRGLRVSVAEDLHGSPCLNPAFFVFGSSSQYSRQLLAQARVAGRDVCRMPEEILSRPEVFEEFVERWADAVRAVLNKNLPVIAAIDRPVIPGAEVARRMTLAAAAMVQRVFSENRALNVFIEGGNTASAIVQSLQWKRFHVSGCLAPGVVQLQAINKCNQRLTVKPGSYPWPESIENVIMRGGRCVE